MLFFTKTAKQWRRFEGGGNLLRSEGHEAVLTSGELLIGDVRLRLHPLQLLRDVSRASLGLQLVLLGVSQA